MGIAYYAPDGQPCTYEDWAAAWRDPAQKIVKQDTVCDGLYDVSTVYTGTDHGWGEGRPLIFETMIFGSGPLGDERWHYSTREEALAGHAEAIKRCEFAYACQFGGVS